MAWKKVYKPFDEGSLVSINGALNLMLFSDLLHSEQSWVILLRSRALKHKKSKSEHQSISEISSWLVDNGQSISFLLVIWSSNLILESQFGLKCVFFW